MAYRVETVNDRPLAARGRYVLYWMTAARRTAWNPGLERAVDWTRRLKRPLVILEALRIGYPWASARLHAFILQGMEANRRALEGRRVRYHPFVETETGQGKGLLTALANQACLVVTDHFPCFFLPRMVRAAAAQLDVRLEAVDSCGLLPLEQPGREFSRAYDFRRYLQKNLLPHLLAPPRADPLTGLHPGAGATIDRDILRRWPAAPRTLLRAEPSALARLPVDHTVAPAILTGGRPAALNTLDEFINSGLERYHTDARHPALGATSGLSPWLHFGHISAHEIFAAVARSQGWHPGLISDSTSGSRQGWWGMGPGAEAFVDQLITWREVGYGFCHHRPDYDEYGGLPDWARASLENHAADLRDNLYSLEQLERAETHDELWNAAQRQLVREGLIQGYLRMVWGKKILEWSPSPRQALAAMIELNNRYALDGRDPNSYSGIFWVLGRFDRAWGPERPIFGKTRFMSSANTRRKLKLGDYLERYGP